MSARLPSEVLDIFERGAFCHVAAETPRGPHLTPMVFAVSGDRLWVTTSRGSVKARAWRRDPRVAGLVRAGDSAVSFTGRVEAYDVLDARTWERGLRRTPALAAASVRFTRKNARFFAGYAVDAQRVPFAWTPPGRVFVEIRIERAAVVAGGVVGATWGVWRPSIVSRETFRATKKGPDALEALPAEIRDALGHKGPAVLAVEGKRGAVVVAGSWAVEGPALYAALPETVLGLAGCDRPEVRAALAVDRPSWWRARRMVGAMVQGSAEVFAMDRVRSGEKSAGARIASTGTDPEGAALLRIRPERLVWWRGWSSGTVMPGGRS